MLRFFRQQQAPIDYDEIFFNKTIWFSLIGALIGTEGAILFAGFGGIFFCYFRMRYRRHHRQRLQRLYRQQLTNYFTYLP